MNDFDKELLKNGVSKGDIDDFNNWLKQGLKSFNLNFVEL